MTFTNKMIIVRNRKYYCNIHQSRSHFHNNTFDTSEDALFRLYDKVGSCACSSPVDYPDEGVRRNGRTNCDYREENYRSSSNGGMKRTSCSPGNNQSRFCHDCGSKFPVASAKFCCQCGVRRLGVS